MSYQTPACIAVPGTYACRPRQRTHVHAAQDSVLCRRSCRKLRSADAPGPVFSFQPNIAISDSRLQANNHTSWLGSKPILHDFSTPIRERSEQMFWAERCDLLTSALSGCFAGNRSHDPHCGGIVRDFSWAWQPTICVPSHTFQHEDKNTEVQDEVGH